MDFEGQTAIITGGAQGIGRAMAEQLAQAGAAIVLSDINVDSAEAAAADIKEKYGAPVAPIKTDVIQKEDIDELIGLAANTFGSVDILINCAGILYQRSIADITAEEWDRVMNINLRGTFFCCQAAAPIMKDQGRGNILMMASVAGKVGGLSAGAHYAVSKAGVICLTKIFARELAPFGVRVNALAPGPVNTPMLNAFAPEIRHELSETCPLGRLAETEDIAAAALFLISPAARHITGEILDINGGILMD